MTASLWYNTLSLKVAIKIFDVRNSTTLIGYSHIHKYIHCSVFLMLLI